MAQVELIMPKMGESIMEATILKWLKQPGDLIEEEESVLEIATDKVDSEVPSSVAGRLAKQLFKEGDVVPVGQAIALIETEVSSRQVIENSPQKPALQTNTYVAFQNANGSNTATHTIAPPNKTILVTPKNNRFYSPLVLNIARTENISMEELGQIIGSGKNGRVTKKDMLGYLKVRQIPNKQPLTTAVIAAPLSNGNGNGTIPNIQSKQLPPIRQKTDTIIRQATPKIPKPAFNSTPKPQAPVNLPPSQPQPQLESKPQPTIATSKPQKKYGENVEIVEMTRMRRLIADHMVMSKNVSPHVTSFVEVDVTNIVKWRNGIKQQFLAREGQKITFTPIFVEAVAKALKDYPMVNASVDGYNIIVKKDINIGMATATPSGELIVPVIKNATELSLLGLTKKVNDLAKRARNNKLKPSEIQGGTFTLTNVGTFGSIMGTPIINQPQVAILAVGAIRKKPAVIETEYGDVIAIRHQMIMSLSYDHRIVDGALGSTFLNQVAKYLEAFDKNRKV